MLLDTIDKLWLRFVPAMFASSLFASFNWFIGTMHIYRSRTILIYFTALVFAFVLGCTITLSISNVDKVCVYNSDALRAASPHSDDNAIFLVILILSAPKNVAQRNALRQTWLNQPKPRFASSKATEVIRNSLDYDEHGFLQQDTLYHQIISLERFKKKLTQRKQNHQLKLDNLKIVHYFAVGTDRLHFIELDALIKERRKHNDLLLLDKLADSYGNLTLKLLQGMSAISNMNSFKYLLKTDDDTFVKLDHLLEELHEYDEFISQKQYSADEPRPDLYWGYFNGRASIKTRGAWKEGNFNLCDRYLPYALGGGYVIANNLVNHIAKQRHTLSRYTSEDVSLGIWLSALRNVYKKHDVRFDTAYMPRKCQSYHIVMHKRTVADMKDLHSGILCAHKSANDSAVQRPAEYFYDWSQTQSRCCDTQHAIIPN